MIQQLLFEVSLFWLHVASALQYLDGYYENPVKYIASLNLKLPLKSAFLVCVVIFGKISLRLFKIYLILKILTKFLHGGV